MCASFVVHCVADIFMAVSSGVLVEQYVLDNIAKLLNVLRECNTTVRWLTLHRTSKSKKIREAVIAATTAEDVIFFGFYRLNFSIIVFMK